MYLLIRWLLNAAALWLTTEIVPGISFTQPGLAPILIAALVLGLVNAVVRPVMILLTLPLTIVTLGLFLLVVNALSLGIVVAIGVRATTGFGTTLVAALLLTIISTALNALIGMGRERD